MGSAMKLFFAASLRCLVAVMPSVLHAALLLSEIRPAEWVRYGTSRHSRGIQRREGDPASALAGPSSVEFWAVAAGRSSLGAHGGAVWRGSKPQGSSERIRLRSVGRFQNAATSLRVPAAPALPTRRSRGAHATRRISVKRSHSPQSTRSRELSWAVAVGLPWAVAQIR